MPELLVPLDGQTVPLKDCRWVKFAPDGCAISSLLGSCAVDEDDAHREFTPRRRDRERDMRRGYSLELLTREQWQERAKACFLGRCQHGAEAAA